MGPEGGSAQANITGFWSAVAAEYEKHPGNTVPAGSPEHDLWVEAIREQLGPSPAAVLDVGTGTGFVALIAAELGHRVTAIDLAEPMLAMSRAEADRRGLRVTFVQGDAVAPDFPPGQFDAITSRHLLWTLREPGLAFGNWFRILRPGGRLVAFDGLWFADSPADDEPNVFTDHYDRLTREALPFFGATTTEPVVQCLEEAGFEDVTCTPQPQLTDPAGGGADTYVVSARRP